MAKQRVKKIAELACRCREIKSPHSRCNQPTTQLKIDGAGQTNVLMAEDQTTAAATTADDDDEKK